MRQIKNYLRSKRTMWNCQESPCATLNAWKCMNEFCGCGEGENSPTAKYTFKDWDGTILKTGIVDDLETPIPPEDPTRESTAQYDYTFAGWEPEVKKITKDTTYTAKYVESVRSYTVTIISNDDTMGTVDESSLIAEYGTTLSANGNVLTIDTVDVTATAETGYIFSSWGELPETVTEDLTITATFEADSVAVTSISDVVYKNPNGDETAGYIYGSGMRSGVTFSYSPSNADTSGISITQTGGTRVNGDDYNDSSSADISITVEEVSYEEGSGTIFFWCDSESQDGQYGEFRIMNLNDETNYFDIKIIYSAGA